MANYSGIYIKCSSTYEAGPFESLVADGCNLIVDGNPAGHYDHTDGLWHITDGEALGNAALTGTTLNIILGQAK